MQLETAHPYQWTEEAGFRVRLERKASAFGQFFNCARIPKKRRHSKLYGPNYAVILVIFKYWIKPAFLCLAPNDVVGKQ